MVIVVLASALAGAVLVFALAPLLVDAPRAVGCPVVLGLSPFLFVVEALEGPAGAAAGALEAYLDSLESFLLSLLD